MTPTSQNRARRLLRRFGEYKIPAKTARTFFLSSFIVFFLIPGLVAQETFRDADVVERETEIEEMAARAARRARERRLMEQLEKVTFQDVIRDPDNVRLNYLYAREQVANNDLLGAAGTLERILMINPNLHPVRLFYAVVLFRLDNLHEAERELDLLMAAQIDPAIRSEAGRYKRQIKQRQKTLRMALRQTVGFGIDTNRNAAPSSKRRLFAETPLPLTGDNRKQRDTNFLNVTSFDIAKDLGFQAGHEVFGNFTYFLQEQTKVDQLDLQAFQYELGTALKNRWVNFTPSFRAGHIMLSRESFLRTQAGRFEIDRKFGLKTDAFFAFLLERQDYMATTGNAASPERKGMNYVYSTGLGYSLTPTMRVFGGLEYHHKTAEQNYNAYDRLALRTGHTWLLGKGQFIANSLDGLFDYYDEPDVAIAGRHRRDKVLRYRVVYGAPLTTLQIGKILPEPMKDIVFSFSYEYFRSLSTITNYTYTNNKFQILLSKRIEF